MNYNNFLQSKIKLSGKTGFKVKQDSIHPILLPHQRDVVVWSLEGGCRAGFLSFGLGKTLIQLETMRQIVSHYSVLERWPKVLIVCPLGVKHEFVRDGKKIGINKIDYITNSSQTTEDQHYYITNYERIRKGDIDSSEFIAVTFDEASILRGLDTQTSEMILKEFRLIKHRFVFTATPSPNRYLELTSYAEFLGIMDRGQILTRFFQRDSTTAGNLNLYEKREKEFWYWMSSWACFITKPSDLGYSNDGYDLPPIQIHKHKVEFDRGEIRDSRTGGMKLFANASKSLQDAAKEKRDSLVTRVDKMMGVINNDFQEYHPEELNCKGCYGPCGECKPEREFDPAHYVIWHHLESEREEIQKRLGGECVSVFGGQSIDQKEKALEGFSEGSIRILSTKPSIAGSGCNFQHHCHKAIFIGIDYKFNDFIQAVHRIYRFQQAKQVEVHIIYTDAESEILRTLEEKWNNHLNLQNQMTEIIKKHGLNSDLYQKDLKRGMFKGRKQFSSKHFEAICNDNVKEVPGIKSDSIGLICSSIPFGNHYEYSENFNCFGHNETNEKFFKQMDFLTPELFRTLMPGRICAIHVKDRIRYSYMNGTGFTSIEPFSDHTNTHFIKHGFHSIGRITITTDVVQENAQTYRLGWTEQCKDGSKMGVGLPEYILLFRKPPTENSNAYADLPVVKEKEKYSRARWQLDAHSYWKSNGERLFSESDLKKMDVKEVMAIWKEYQIGNNYSIEKHQQLCEMLDGLGKLPTKFMAAPVVSTNPDVWTDIVRMKTLNSDQARRKLTKHICPLQLDLIERIIERYSNKDETVFDPFGGIMSVPYVAIKMKRRGFGIELNEESWRDGCKHLQRAEIETNSQSLFDLIA